MTGEHSTKLRVDEKYDSFAHAAIKNIVTGGNIEIQDEQPPKLFMH